MIEQVLITTTADTSQAEKEYIGLRQEIKLLKTQLDGLEEGTKEYNETFTKLSAKMFEQKERMQALKNSAGDLGQMLGNVSGLAGTISQGFAGATAALSLFGIENENLLRTIQKVQAFESIARTLTELEDAPKKIKALFNNIKGVFGSSNKLTIDVQDQTQGVAKVTKQTIDNTSFEKAAEAAERTSIASNATAGSASVTSAQQSITSAELKIQTKEKLKQLALDKEQYTTQIVQGEAGLRILELQKDKYEANIETISRLTSERERVGTVEFDMSDAYADQRRELSSTLKSAEQYAVAHRDLTDNITESKEGLKKTNEQIKLLKSGISGIGSAFKSIAIGAGIGLAISAAIVGVTKLIEYFKKLGDATRLRYQNAVAFANELGTAQSNAINKELSLLKTLDAGYKNLGKNKEKQIEYLNTNKDKYKEIGIEVDKIIIGEVDYRKEIERTTNALVERGKQMGIVNLLIDKYSKQFEIQTQRILSSSQLERLTPFNFTFVRSSISDINKQVSDLIVEGYGNVGDIVDQIKLRNQDAFSKLTSDQLSQLKTGIYSMLSAIPDETQKQLSEQSVEYRKISNEISILEPQVKSFYDDTKKSTADATVNLKTYNQLLSELLKLYPTIELNNPFTPEEARKNELFFITTKEGIESLILSLTKLGGNYEDTIKGLEEYQIKILEAEREYNTKIRDLKVNEAAWERDNTIRTNEEQLLLKKDQYKQIILDAKESFKAGAITEKEFKDIQDKVNKSVDTSILEFTKLLNKQLTSGEINFQQFRSKLNEFAGTDLTVLDPTNIDYGTLTVDNYNYLQDLISNWEDYYEKVQEANTTFKDSDKATTEEIFAVRMSTIDKFGAEISRKTTEANAKVSMSMNARNTQLWTVGFAGIRSGYLDVLDEITQLQNEASLASSNQTFLQQRIDLMNEELNSETITAEKRIELLDAIKQAEADLTASKQTETERRLSIAQKEQEVRDEIFNGIKEAITDIDSVISAGYDLAEQSELLRLKKLYNAKLLTQEEYTTQSEAISDKYTKKRLELEIFTGTMSAIGTSIAAFQSAAESKIPYPYNLILAGISSAAAFGSVMASVSQLQSLSVGDTSVSPTASSTGSGLTYSLNQQAASNERLMNSLNDQRIYVLESDITGTQATIKEIEEMSTF